MSIKTDTKEKFTVITPEGYSFAANMAEELRHLVLPYLQKVIPHIVLDMKNITQIDDTGGKLLADLQQQFYENNCSFVICCLQAQPQKMLTDMELLDLMNTTPTESEAWDILQMEEIERELMQGDDL